MAGKGHQCWASLTGSGPKRHLIVLYLQVTQLQEFLSYWPRFDLAVCTGALDFAAVLLSPLSVSLSPQCFCLQHNIVMATLC